MDIYCSWRHVGLRILPELWVGYRVLRTGRQL